MSQLADRARLVHGANEERSEAPSSSEDRSTSDPCSCATSVKVLNAASDSAEILMSSPTTDPRRWSQPGPPFAKDDAE